MSNLLKTISYLKRNGLVKTYHRVIEQRALDNLFSDYNETRRTEVATSEDLKAQEKYEFNNKRLISIIVPLYMTDEVYLRSMIDSVLLQSYENWELILPDGSTDSSCEAVLSEYDDERIKYFRLNENRGISDNTNEGLKKATGEIIAFMDHDDYIEQDALFYIAKAFDDGAMAAYTDEDKVRSNGKDYFMPNKKYDFNYDLLLSNNYICHLFAVDREVAKKAGFLNRDYDGAQDFDFILRCVEVIALENGGYSKLGNKIIHIKRTLYHWRCHELSTADNPESKLYAYDAGKRAVNDHLKRRGIKANVRHTDHLGFYHVDYDDIFERPEVGAYVGRNKKLKVYTENDGPYLLNEEGKLYNPYLGLKIYESGYMHRAKMQQDVDDAWRENVVFRDECKNMKTEDIRDKGYLLVYDPEKIV